MPDKGTPSLRVGASSGRITTLLFIIFLISWAFPTCVTFVKCTQTAVGLVNDKEHFDNTAAAAPADVHGGDDEDKEDDNQGLNGSAVTNGDGGGDDTAAPAAPPSLGTRSRIQQLVHASAKRGHGRRKKKAWKVRVDASSSSSSSSPEVVGSAATGEAEHHHHHRHPSSVGIAKKHSKLKDVIAAEQQRNKRWQQLLQQQQEQKQGGQTPTICFFDWARNERTAAAFVTNIFGRSVRCSVLARERSGLILSPPRMLLPPPSLPPSLPFSQNAACLSVCLSSVTQRADHQPVRCWKTDNCGKMPPGTEARSILQW